MDGTRRIGPWRGISLLSNSYINSDYCSKRIRYSDLGNLLIIESGIRKLLGELIRPVRAPISGERSRYLRTLRVLFQEL